MERGDRLGFLWGPFLLWITAARRSSKKCKSQIKSQATVKEKTLARSETVLSSGIKMLELNLPHSH